MKHFGGDVIGKKLKFFSKINLKLNLPHSGSTSSVTEPPTVPPALRQYPISYIRAFAYHPVAFPQPLAPITTYTVRNPLPSRSLTHQQLPNLQNPQDFGTPSTTPSTTTTTTTTTTPPPTTTTTSPFSGSQPIPQSYSRGEFGQRQLPFNAYQNYGGFPYYYNNQYSYRYDETPTSQFSGRVYGGEPNYQQYSIDPITYQFIPTSITPIQPPQNSVKFVPCMCPVAVQVSPPIALKERTNEPETPILSSPISSTESNTSPSTSLEEESVEEAK